MQTLSHERVQGPPGVKPEKTNLQPGPRRVLGLGGRGSWGLEQIRR